MAMSQGTKAADLMLLMMMSYLMDEKKDRRRCRSQRDQDEGDSDSEDSKTKKICGRLWHEGGELTSSILVSYTWSSRRRLPRRCPRRPTLVPEGLHQAAAVGQVQEPLPGSDHGHCRLRAHRGRCSMTPRLRSIGLRCD